MGIADVSLRVFWSGGGGVGGGGGRGAGEREGGGGGWGGGRRGDITWQVSSRSFFVSSVHVKVTHQYVASRYLVELTPQHAAEPVFSYRSTGVKDPSDWVEHDVCCGHLS